MRRWTSWWLALQQPAGGRSQMADGEGREGRWWPVGGLARTKPAALRATRLHPSPLCRYLRPSEQHPPEEAPEYTGRDPEDMRLVNHSFGDGPLVQSQTSANPLIADDFAPPCGPPGGEDCHRGAVAVVARAVCLDPVRRS